MAAALPAIMPYLTAASAAVGIAGGIKSLTAKGPKDPKDPVAAKVAPVTDDKSALRTRQKEMQRRYGAAGRTGTILSEGSSLG